MMAWPATAWKQLVESHAPPLSNHIYHNADPQDENKPLSRTEARGHTKKKKFVLSCTPQKKKKFVLPPPPSCRFSEVGFFTAANTKQTKKQVPGTWYVLMSGSQYLVAYLVQSSNTHKLHKHRSGRTYHAKSKDKTAWYVPYPSYRFSEGGFCTTANNRKHISEHISPTIDLKPHNAANTENDGLGHV